MRYIKFLIVALIGLLMACSSEEVMTESYKTDTHSLNIEVAQSNLTRVAYDGLDATFESGDIIGLYAVDASGTVKASNVAFTYDGSSWTAASNVAFNPNWSYYAYYPYVTSPYTPDFSQSGVDNQFATFITDASNKFHLADQSTKVNFNASDLMIAQGTLSGTNTVKFAMDHKKALAIVTVPEAAAPFLSFSGNIPYASDGNFLFCMKANTATDIAGYSLSGDKGRVVRQNITDLDTSGSYLTFEALGEGTFSVSNAQGTFYYSKNGGNWTSGTSVSVAAGDIVRWKAEATPTASFGVGTFNATGQFEIGGNPLSLLYGADFEGVADISDKEYAIRCLFQNNTYLKSAEYLSLPATTLADYCYYYMFHGCTGLTTAPELPATTLANNCYMYMFQGCTGLTTAPELPATTLYNYCYYGMFNGCTGLTTAPELPATTLVSSCYCDMFNGCTGLTTVPELPATTLATYCYQYMFKGCTSLTSAPNLPITILAEGCYWSMFQGCTGLTTAPELPTTTLAQNCYREMFNGCSNLNYIKMMATDVSASYCLYNWVNGVASSGTFVKNSAATWNNSYYQYKTVYRIPSGWTVETASE